MHIQGRTQPTVAPAGGHCDKRSFLANTIHLAVWCTRFNHGDGASARPTSSSLLDPLFAFPKVRHTGRGPQASSRGGSVRRRLSSRDDGGVSGLFSSGGPSVRFLRGTTARSVSLSWGAREVGSPCEWRGGRVIALEPW